MSPYEPINGISLERYAELGAEVADHTHDPEAQARIVEGLGVSRADWEAAQKGWTARMQDMSLMGQVATAFMPLYQAALAKKKGTVEVSYDDWVALNAASQAYGLERMLATYGLDMAAWTQIAGTWNTRMSQNMMQFQSFHPTVAAEAQRIRAGAPHRPVNSQRQAGGAQVAGQGAVAAQPQPVNAQAAAQQYQNQMMGAAAQANVAAAMAQANAQAAAAYGNVANNVGFLGRGALGVMGLGAIASGIGPGMTVMVTWPDGNRYPGSVVQVANGQVLVTFQNGQQNWVPETAVARQ
jgi:hypothetical protein